MSFDITFKDPNDKTAWDAATPFCRGDLFNLGRRLWDRRDEVLRDDVVVEHKRQLDAVRNECDVRLCAAVAERAILRRDLQADVEVWVARHSEAVRDAGARAEALKRLEDELGCARKDGERALHDEVAMAKRLATEASKVALQSLEQKFEEELRVLRRSKADTDDALRRAEATAKEKRDVVCRDLRVEYETKMRTMEASHETALRHEQKATEIANDALQRAELMAQAERDAAMRELRLTSEKELSAARHMVAEAKAALITQLLAAQSEKDAAMRDLLVKCERELSAARQADAAAKTALTTQYDADLRNLRSLNEKDLAAVKAALSTQHSALLEERDAALRDLRQKSERELTEARQALETVKHEFLRTEASLERQVADRVRAENTTIAYEHATELAAVKVAIKVVEAERDRLASENERYFARTARLYVGDAASKGRAGEEAAKDAIERQFPGSSVKNQGATGACGDLWWTLPGRARPILVEVKNYTNALPQKEVDKFHRDVEVNRELISGALLVCYRCPSVPTMPGKMFIDTSSGVPFVAVCEAEERLPVVLSAFITYLDRLDVVNATRVDDCELRKMLAERMSAELTNLEATLKSTEESTNEARLAAYHANKGHLAAQKALAQVQSNLDFHRETLKLVVRDIVAPAAASAPQQSEQSHPHSHQPPTPTPTPSPVTPTPASLADMGAEEWLNACYDRTDDKKRRIASTKLYERFKHDTGNTTMTLIMFGKALRKMGIQFDKGKQSMFVGLVPK